MRVAPHRNGGNGADFFCSVSRLFAYFKTIHINVADIPPEVGESFGRVTLAGFKKFIAQPGNREKLEAQTAARKARKERECKE